MIHVKAMFKNCITICNCTVPLNDSKNQKISQNTSNTLFFALFFNSTIIGAFFKTQWIKLDSLNAHATPQFAWNNFWLNDIMWCTWKKIGRFFFAFNLSPTHSDYILFSPEIHFLQPTMKKKNGKRKKKLQINGDTKNRQPFCLPW